jgi:hypothetical protein
LLVIGGDQLTSSIKQTKHENRKKFERKFSFFRNKSIPERSKASEAKLCYFEFLDDLIVSWTKRREYMTHSLAIFSNQDLQRLLSWAPDQRFVLQWAWLQASLQHSGAAASGRYRAGCGVADFVDGFLS